MNRYGQTEFLATRSKAFAKLQQSDPGARFFLERTAEDLHMLKAAELGSREAMLHADAPGNRVDRTHAFQRRLAFQHRHRLRAQRGAHTQQRLCRKLRQAQAEVQRSGRRPHEALPFQLAVWVHRALRSLCGGLRIETTWSAVVLWGESKR